MAVWDTSTPAGSDNANQGDDRIREFKVAVQDALRAGEADGDEALFPGPNPTSDPIYRPRMGKGAEASRPAAAVGGLYYNETTGTIQRSNSSAWVDLTENAAFEAIHQKAAAALASVAGVVTLPETGNSFNVSGAEAITSIAGWSAGIVIIKWGSARTLTHAAALYLLGAVSRAVDANDISIFEFTASNNVREIARYGAMLPTRQVFTSGSGNYTTPVGVRQLVIRQIGAGGGGAGSDTGSNGSVGGNSSFNAIVSTGGGGGVGSVTFGGGAGGTGGAGSSSISLDGGPGQSGSGSYIASANNGGNGAFGGGAPNPNNGSGPGAAGKTNTGGGGSGGFSTTTTSGGGGGAGQYREIIINNPTLAQVFAYVVGAGGAGGAGTQAGGAGGSGIVIVDEIY